MRGTAHVLMMPVPLIVRCSMGSVLSVHAAVDGPFRRTCHSSSGVEHPIRNRAVVSSILTCGSLAPAGVIQLVECQLPKLDVAGSSPVARSPSDYRSLALRNFRMAD